MIERHRSAALVLLPLALASGGCAPAILCSWFEDDAQPPVRPEDLAFVSVGRTTREELLLHLGQPYWTRDADRLLLYLWARDVYTWNGNLYNAARLDTACQVYAAEFDAEGVLVRSDYLEPILTNPILGVGSPLFHAALTERLAWWRACAPVQLRRP